MSDSMDGMAAIEPIFRKALGCSDCFLCQGSKLQRALVDMAQPRPIGEAYWTSELRVLLLLLNPAAGKIAHAGANQIFRRLLHAYADGSATLEAVFQH